MTASCRKRLRGAEDDCDECVPISKRISGLHIRPEDQSLVTKDMLENSSNLGAVSPLLANKHQMEAVNRCMPLPVPNYPNSRVELPVTNNIGCNLQSRLALGMQQLHGAVENDTCERIVSPQIVQRDVNSYDVDRDKYEPEMDLSDNPHYYNINKVLFGAHLERNHRRLGVPPS